MAGNRPFGAIALELGLISAEELEAALALQMTQATGPLGHQLLGVLLVDLGFMTGAEVCRVLEAQEAESRELERQIGIDTERGMDLGEGCD